MNIKKIMLLAVALAAWNTGAALAADVNGAVKLDKELCAVCHGVGGRSTSPLFPRIAGQHAAYLEEQLKAFRDKTRSDKDAQDYMWGWASLLTDDDIKTLAAYYEKQTPAPGEPGGDPQVIAKGQEIFTKGLASQGVPACMVCHGANGEGNAQMVPAVPRLAGQNLFYLKKQLNVSKGNQRPMAVAMHAIVGTLTDEEIEQVAQFLHSK